MITLLFLDSLLFYTIVNIIFGQRPPVTFSVLLWIDVKSPCISLLQVSVKIIPKCRTQKR